MSLRSCSQRSLLHVVALGASNGLNRRPCRMHGKVLIAQPAVFGDKCQFIVT